MDVLKRAIGPVACGNAATVPESRNRRRAGGIDERGKTLNTPARPPRDLGTAVKRGFFSRCPNCGKGHLFRAFLKVSDHCEVCGEDYTHQRADDAPAYFVMLIVGHITVPLMLLL